MTTSTTSTSKRSARSPLIAVLFVIIAALLLTVGVLVADRNRLLAQINTPAPAQAQSAQTADSAEFAPSETNADLLALIRDQPRRDANDPQAKGNVDATVVLTLYSDFACPYCTLFAQSVEPGLEDLVKEGTLRIEWRDLAQITETSPLAAQAGIAAGEQGKFWEFHDALYHATDPQSHPEYSQESLISFARQIGITDIDRFTATMNSEETAATIANAKTSAYRIGITGTPFMFIGDSYISGYRDLDYVRATILKQAESAQ
ncbi:DsbA family protein [Actinomyces mediterranea]|uniref:DsbA family protein n=1 Tax=Actinomyces mediterranea TaxID=1871028 RepID=UPI0009705D3C|nr:thioredoxin domain-containing protein [Actinomyces mediterranea]